jgi:hypothetical protein
LEKQIGDAYVAMSNKLRKLGEAPSQDPTAALLGLLSEFDTLINKNVEGQPEHERFMQTVNEGNAAYVKALRYSQPVFVAQKRCDNDHEDERVLNQALLDEIMENDRERMYLDDMKLHIEG